MNKIIDKTNWIPFLKAYSATNENRPTRLGVFEKGNGSVEDLWVEDGLPLVAVDLYSDSNAMRVDLVFDNYVHPVEDVVCILEYTSDNDAGLDFVDNAGRTTILRFENWQ